MKALLWKLIRQWRDATTTEATWIARDQVDIELDKFEAAATQEPVEHQYQSRDGQWLPFINEGHYQNTIKDGSWPIRALYLAAGAAPEPTFNGKSAEYWNKLAVARWQENQVLEAKLAALELQEPVAEVLLVDGEKVIDASMAFFDSVELGTKLYLAAGAAPDLWI